MSDNELKYKITVDASEAESKFAKLKKAAEDVGKSGSAGSGLSGATKQTRALADSSDLAARKLEDLRGRFARIEAAKPLANSVAAARDLDKQMVSNLRSQERYTKNEKDLAAVVNQRVGLQEKLNKGMAEFSAHSQRQFGQLTKMSGQVAGQLLMFAGRAGQAVYSQSMGAYENLNARYNFDPGLTASQRNMEQARFNVGGQLSGYQQYKNNLATALLNSGAAAPLAMAGDIGGGALQAFGALKYAGVSGKALGVLGSIGGGVALGSLLAQGISGGKAANPLDALMYLLAPGALGSTAAAQYMGSAAFNFKSGKEKQDEATYRGQRAGVLEEYKAAFEEMSKKQYLNTGEDPQKAEARVNARYEKAKQRASDAGWNVQELINDNPDLRKIDAQIQADKDIANGVKQQQQLLGQFLKSPQYGLQIQRMQNQRSDFYTDLNLQQNIAARQYGRGVASLGRQRQYENEDFAVTEKKIQLGRVRAAEDYGHQLEAIDLSVYRTKRDAAIQTERLEQDTTRRRLIINQDFYKDWGRLQEDNSRQQTRMNVESSLKLTRLNEDTSREQLRLTQDTNKAKIRSDEDFQRSTTEITRSAARSRQDLQTSYHDSLLGLLAPGLANSKMMQLFRLRRDYTKGMGRIGEDEQFALQGAQMGYSRQRQDIAQQYSRSTEDIAREKERGQADIDREKKWAEEDLAREKVRAEADMVVNKARQEEQISIDQSRASFDILKNVSDALKDADIARRDATIAYTRSLQDSALAEQDAIRQHNRALQENDIALTQLTEDYQTQVNEFAKALARFNRDWDLTVKETAQNLSKEFGVAAGDIELSLTTSLDGITGANAASIQAIKDAQATALANIAAAQGASKKGKSAAIGEWDTGTGGQYLLHPNEMVIPKAMADPLRAMLTLPGGPGGSYTPSSSNYAPSMPANGFQGSYSGAGGQTIQIINQPGAFTMTGGGMTPAQVQKVWEKHMGNFRNEIQETAGKQINFASSAGF